MNKLKVNQQFDYVGDFYNGIAVVLDNDKGYNYITTKGNYLSDEWFDYANDFLNGYGKIVKNDKENLIKPDGTLLFDKYYDRIIPSSKNKLFSYGFVRVIIDNKMNYINCYGQTLLNDYVEECGDFYFSRAIVHDKDKFYVIDTKGNKLSDNYDYVTCYVDGYALVFNENKANILNIDCNLISNQWFDNCDYFHYGVARVQLGEKCNYIDTNGEILSDKWFEDGEDFDANGLCIVIENKKYNIINNRGNLLLEKWFDFIEKRITFCKNILYVIVDGDKYNFVNVAGKFLSDVWFDEIVTDVIAKRNGKSYSLNLNNDIIVYNDDEKQNKKEYYEHVNHPSHYNNYSFEVIDMFEKIYGKEATALWCEMTALKYRMRMGTKPDNDLKQDIEKEKWYLNKRLELIK